MPSASDVQAAQASRAANAGDRLARQVDRLAGDARRCQAAGQRRRRRRAVEDDHTAIRRDRPHAPVERETPAGARRDHARPIVVGERQVLIVRPGRVDDPPRRHADQAVARDDGQQARRAVLGEKADRRRARVQLGAGSARGCRRFRSAGGAGRLGQPRAAQVRLLVVKDHARAGRGFGRGARRSQAGRPAADDADVDRALDGNQPVRRRRVRKRPRPAHLAHQLQEERVARARAGHHRVVIHPVGEQPVGGCQQIDVGAGERILSLAAQVLARGDPAGALVGAPVDAHQAGGAMPIQAEEPARAMVLGRPGQRVDAGGVQRDRQRLPLERGDGVTLEVEADGAPARGGRDEVSQVSGHASTLPARPRRSARAAGPWCFSATVCSACRRRRAGAGASWRFVGPRRGARARRPGAARSHRREGDAVARRRARAGPQPDGGGRQRRDRARRGAGESSAMPAGTRP